MASIIDIFTNRQNLKRAADPLTLDYKLHRLAGEGNEQIRAKVAANTTSALHTLEMLAKDESETVQLAVVSNEWKMSERIFKYLGQSNFESVKQELAETYPDGPPKEPNMGPKPRAKTKH